MRIRGRRRLVVDANVARSAGETEHAVSSACRSFLNAITKSEHRVVMTDEIQQEWREHASKYSSRWLTSMYARKLVFRSAVRRDDQFRKRVAQHHRNTHDMHLVEAATATDRLVASQDERARLEFGTAAVNIRELRRIVWVNPAREAEAPIDWLRSGAVAEASRMLGP